MAWSVQAGSDQRAEAVCHLADTYLNDAVAAEDRRATEQVFTLYLKDPDANVRASLAERLAPSTALPRWMLWGFLNDVSAVAEPVYGLSPQLSCADLLVGVAREDVAIGCAIAQRADIGEDVVVALCERGSEFAIIALLANTAVELGPRLLQEVAVRLGDNPDARAALLAREDLPAVTRQTLLQSMSSALLSLVAERGWNDRPGMAHTAHDALNRASIELATDGGDDLNHTYVQHLLNTGQLTPAFLLRALCSGELILVEHAFAQLSGMSVKRVRAILQARRLAAFKPLFVRTGLPVGSYAGFSTAILAWHETDCAVEVLDAVLAATELSGDVDAETHALLGRMVAESHAIEATTYERQLMLEAA